MDDNLALQGPPRPVVRENTYIIEPIGYGEKLIFRRHKVQAVIESALQEKMAGQRYDPVKAAQQTKQFADHVREKVKTLGFDRHKLIVQVTLAQKQGQALRLASRCLWDATADSCASSSFETESLVCNCQVYGLYYE